jgi:hypothetical protein
MNCRSETTKMGVPPGTRPAVPRDWARGVPEWYVAGAYTRGRQEGRTYPWSQQVIHGMSGLRLCNEVQLVWRQIPTQLTSLIGKSLQIDSAETTPQEMNGNTLITGEKIRSQPRQGR